MEAISGNLPVVTDYQKPEYCRRGDCDDKAVNVSKASDLAVVATAPPPEASEPVEQSTALRYSRSEKTSLMIRTQEGDVVTLRFRQSESVALDANSSDDGETELTEIDLNAKTSTKLRVMIKGDLNADELSAIRSVVEQAGSLASAFFSGDASGAFDQASQLQIDGQQLAKVALRFRVRENLSYAQTGPSLPLPALVPSQPGIVPAASTEASSEQPLARVSIAAESSSRTAVRIRTQSAGPIGDTSAATGFGAPSPAGTSTAPPADTSAAPAAPSADPAPAAAGDEAASDVPAPADTPATQAPATSNYFEALNTVFDFLARILDTFAPGADTGGDADLPADTDTGESGPVAQSGQDGVEFSLKLRLFSSLVASIRTETVTDAADPVADASEPAVTLLTDTVDAIAAASDRPLTETA